MHLNTINKCLAGANKDKITICMATEYEGGNFGNLLARYIVEELSGKETVKYADDNAYHLCSVGSVLTRNKICSNTIVWGSGFLSPQAQYKIVLTKIRQWFRRKTGKPVYLAVRGEKTREILLKAGYECPSVYGDPALLMPKIYYPKSSPKFKVGVILHWSQEKFVDMFSHIEGVRLININRGYNEVTSFVDEVLSCESILSSSLHGLIIANAYGVPCVRLKIDGHSIAKTEGKDDFKFEDYLSGLNLCKENKEDPDYTFNTLFLKPGVRQSASLIEAVKSKSIQRDFEIDLTPLVQAFPFLVPVYQHKEFKV